MPIKFNFNICDNSPECSGMSVCPTNAIKWDENLINLFGSKGSLYVDNDNCISCGKCVSEDGCPVGAIIFAKSEEELSEISKDFEIDTTKVESLFVDRYGAEPIDESIFVSSIDTIINNFNSLVILEEFSDSSIQCLINSIPISTIIKKLGEKFPSLNILYYKKAVESNELKESLPKLSVYEKGIKIAQINGYYNSGQSDEFFKDIFKQIK